MLCLVGLLSKVLSISIYTSLPQESFLGEEGDLEVVPDKHVDNIHFPLALAAAD